MEACNNAGVCPRLLLTPWAGMVRGAMSWWEQGSLGVTYLDAPAWLHHAFGVISQARSEAMRYHSKQMQDARKKG
jgi:hypothetical protein